MNAYDTDQLANLAEDTTWLLDNGEHPEHVARRLGHTLAGLEKLFRRHGYRELSNRLGRARQHWRAAA